MAMVAALCSGMPIPTLRQQQAFTSMTCHCGSSPSTSTSPALAGPADASIVSGRYPTPIALSLPGTSLRTPSNVGGLGGDRWSSIGVRRMRRSGRKTMSPNCSTGGQPAMVSVSDEANISELPCLPFTPAEVFVPSSTKVLHLYEARFLALLEEVVGKYDNLFAHIVIEPLGFTGKDEERKEVTSFLATYGCLVRVEKVERLEIGAEVTIRGIGRIKVLGLTQLEPFLKGTVTSLKDEVSKDKEELAHALAGLRTTLSTVQKLQIKLKVSKTELLQTPLERALQWAEKGEPDEAAKLYVPSLEERVSFAALQPIAGASASEQHKLLQERLFAMEAMTTLQRLNRVNPFAQQMLASLAAKVSLQSLNL